MPIPRRISSSGWSGLVVRTKTSSAKQQSRRSGRHRKDHLGRSTCSAITPWSIHLQLAYGRSRGLAAREAIQDVLCLQLRDTSVRKPGPYLVSHLEAQDESSQDETPAVKGKGRGGGLGKFFDAMQRAANPLDAPQQTDGREVRRRTPYLNWMMFFSSLRDQAKTRLCRTEESPKRYQFPWRPLKFQRKSGIAGSVGESIGHVRSA